MSRRADPSDWMWKQACDMLEEAERMQRRFFRLASSSPAQARWEPPADVFEDERELVIVVALPGVELEAVQLATEGSHLVVHAERPLPFTDPRRAVRQLEIPYGIFERRIPLPAVPLEIASRELTHGCLVLRLRKLT